MTMRRTIFVLCLAAHFKIIFFSVWISNLLERFPALLISILIGICYLLYPLCGWLTEVYSNSFKVIKYSFMFMILSSLAVATGSIVLINMKRINDVETENNVVGIFLTPFCAAGIAGLGMFEANAIQFGMDQMMDESSEYLSSYIHWYFWGAHVGPLVIFYVLSSSYLLLEHLNLPWLRSFHKLHSKKLEFITIIISSVEIAICIAAGLFIAWSKRNFQVVPMSRNSLKLLYRVVRYSYNHKHPVRRSALSYWENDIPSRIDLGKDKYGGPFTYEQVEEVKTFFRLLLLMVSLFGFFLLGDGFSLTQYIMKQNGCPSLPFFLLATLNPQHISLLIVLIGVPVIRGLIKISCRYIPSLLSRLWIGLFTALIAVTIQTLFSLLMERNIDIHFQSNGIHSHSIVSKCASLWMESIFSSNFTCQNHPNSDNMVYIFILPLILYGVSYLLVFMTMLEFICAQAPNSMKGLLVGLWYSMLSIKYCIIYNLDTVFLDAISWYIYNLVKGVGIFVSVLLFSLACKRYRFRERNEVVNFQNMIEEQYERELLMNTESDGSYESITDDSS